MTKNSLIQKVEEMYLKKELPEFRVGDTVKVMQKVTEGNKVRSQAFEGVVIGKKGSGIQLSFTVRRISLKRAVRAEILSKGAETFSIFSKKPDSFIFKASISCKTTAGPGYG